MVNLPGLFVFTLELKKTVNQKTQMALMTKGTDKAHSLAEGFMKGQS